MAAVFCTRPAKPHRWFIKLVFKEKYHDCKTDDTEQYLS